MNFSSTGFAGAAGRDPSLWTERCCALVGGSSFDERWCRSIIIRLSVIVAGASSQSGFHAIGR